MKSFLVTATLLSLLAAPAPVAEEQMKKSMKLFERHHYDEAAALLMPALPSLGPSKQGVAFMTMGTSYLRSSELHGKLHQTGLIVTAEYYRKLAAERGRARSRFVDLYLGELLLETGKPEVAAAPIEKFLADTGVPRRDHDIAAVLLGSSMFQRGEQLKAEELWKSVDSSDPEVGTELAAAFSRAGMKDRDPQGLCEQALESARKKGKTVSPRMLKNAIAIYVKNKQVDKGLDLVRNADLRAPSSTEHVSSSKVINFYSVSLSDDLAALYLLASLSFFEKASRDPTVRDIANYHMGEAYAQSGDVAQSSKAYLSFIGNTRVPQQLRDRATVRQAANRYRAGKRHDAIGAWDEIARRRSDDAELLGEILRSCGSLHIECPTVVKKADAAVEGGQGKKFSFLNVSLGDYYLGRRDYAKALTYLETGRDKGNKNKIEANEPALLLDLAELYYRSKKYSEALEIYFEMSKHYPAIRQVQEPLQGIYSKEQKSAGDVKIN